MAKVCKSCENCKRRWFHSWSGVESCMDWAMSDDPVKTASDCPAWSFDPDWDKPEDHYCPSATAGDYGPGNPWDAPGMSIRDFI